MTDSMPYDFMIGIANWVQDHDIPPATSVEGLLKFQIGRFTIVVNGHARRIDGVEPFSAHANLPCGATIMVCSPFFSAPLFAEADELRALLDGQAHQERPQ